MAESTNLQRVREMLAVPAVDVDTWLSYFSEDVVWEALEDAPDAGTYRGHAGIRGYLEDWLGTVDDPEFEVREVNEMGDIVVGEFHFAARIKGTDNEVILDFWEVWRFADGKIRRIKEFREREEAIAFAEADAPDP